MSSIGSPAPFFFGGAKSYGIERSLRFNNGDSHKLTRTFGTNTSNTTKTVSFWVKRGNVSSSSHQNIFSTTISGMIEGRLFFLTDDRLQFEERDASGGSSDGRRITTQKFRDVSAWYHVVLVLNSTESTEIDRAKIYVNGTQVTAFDQTRNISQNYSFSFFRSSVDNFIGVMNGSSEYFDGYLAEINFIDGQALTPASFGETDSTTGQWIPKEYTGTYGNNGFYLNFSDNSSTTAATLGKDSSGNGNNFTPSNFGATNVDAVKDTPSNNFATLNAVDFNGGSLLEGSLKQDNSGATNTSGTFGMQSGKWYWEIYFNSSSGGVFGVGIGESRKGSALNDLTRHYGYSTNGQFYTTVNGSSTAAGYGATLSAGDILSVKFNADTREIDFLKNNSSQGYTVTLADGFLYLPSFHANNSDITVNFGQDSTFAGATSSGGNTDGNGQGDFKYAVPSGYKALCSANLPDPTIKLPNKHFDTLTWAGDGSANRSITGLQFEPDWTWIKNRSQATTHSLQDSVIGFGDDKTLRSDTNGALDTNGNLYGYINNALSNGVSLNAGSSASSSRVNSSSSGATHVGWFWDAGETDGKTYTVTVVSDSGNKYRFDGFGTSAVTLDLAEGGTYTFNYPSAHPLRFSTTADGTHGGGSEYTTGVSSYGNSVTITVAASAPQLFYFCTQHSGMGGAINTNSTLGSSNFDGSIQTIVKANTTAGFSIVTYTGTGADATIGHGLGVTPNVAITKKRSGSQNWSVKHSAVSGKVGYLDMSDPFDNSGSGGGIVSDFSSSSNYSVTRYNNSGNYGNVNESSATYVAYVFSEVAGFSKFGRYDGNNNSDGIFVYTGFSVAWLMIKRYETSRDWIIYDNKRSTFNVIDDFLEPNNNTAEQTSSSNNVDFLSNGFKFRGSDGDMNGAGDYIYFAFAESPFKYARAR